jgi:uncharacterized protein YcbK (DUF882 family)
VFVAAQDGTSGASPARRRLLACACCALAALRPGAGAAQAKSTNEAPLAPLPRTEQAPVQDWRQLLLKDRRTLRVQRGAETVEATYWTAERGWNRDEYYALCWVMRDVKADRVFPIDRKLLDVLCGVQAWLAYNGHAAPIRINSAYRTLATNRATEGSARDSKHVVGKAADILVDGVSSVKLAVMASEFGRGGTGFYVGRGFVHVDTGDERIWIDKGRRPSQ